MRTIAKRIYKKIEQADNILLIPHKNPDGDALGSISALGIFLKKINKKYQTFCATETSEKLNKLVHIETIGQDENVWQNEKFDLIIVLDSGDLEYAGVKKYIKKIHPKTLIINIDHHPTNQLFGHHNLVIPTASSTTEILYYFFKHNEIEIDKNIAINLLTGLVTDTDNFSNPGTTLSSLSIASELINLGANFNLLKGQIMRNKTVNSLKLWGVVLSRLELHKKHDIVYTYLNQADLKKHKVSETETEGIANFLNNLDDGKASLILKELPDKKIKGSFRTTRDDIDVSQMAQNFGGGGHKKASGFTISGTIENALDKIWSELEKSV